MNKVCTKCGVEKSFEEFHKDSSNQDGRMSRCADCENQDQKEWRIRNPEKVNQWARNNPEKQKAHVKAYRMRNPEKYKNSVVKWQKEHPERMKHNHLKLTYGITLEEFKEQVTKQENKCAICAKEMLPPHIDHDHITGKVRELLCATCNRGLGHFQDSPEALRKAASYLDRLSTPKVQN